MLWQSSQLLLLLMWPLFLPVAAIPLWQLAQLPVTAEWSNTAPSQLLVVWQSSQLLPLAIWLGDLPSATVPLWQLAQVPITAL
ncbi:hypothetical protein E3W66_05110 [Gammaproteobacteria bacterium LSUCC0057]|uniref:Uncharacterized protein n=1 Tax=Gammaproteobacteria bacterium LSUCC0057 TaxID=2559237 RepID=A0A4Y8UKC6_9GAMM|nr:hypothetical protein E3W66_05110 [Gammaproteobacteria bacterium LSUCC0057]